MQCLKQCPRVLSWLDLFLTGRGNVPVVPDSLIDDAIRARGGRLTGFLYCRGHFLSAKWNVNVGCVRY